MAKQLQLRVQDAGIVDGLPHELTHVILADQLIDCSVPTWLNEGMAMLSECEALQSQRLTLLKRAEPPAPWSPS
jgi:hypothetical protein